MKTIATRRDIATTLGAADRAKITRILFLGRHAKVSPRGRYASMSSGDVCTEKQRRFANRQQPIDDECPGSIS